MKIQSYRELIAYQKAYQLTLDIYKTTKKFPKEELFGISYLRCGEARCQSPAISQRAIAEITERNMFSF
jgi:hypothetical protein